MEIKRPQVSSPVTYEHEFWEDGAAVDLTNATSCRIIFYEVADAGTTSVVGAFNADKTTGKITASFTASEIGEMRWQGAFTDGDGEHFGPIHSEQIIANLV